MPSLDCRLLSAEFVALALFVACLLGLGVYECFWAWNINLVSKSRIVPATSVSLIDPAPEPTTDYQPAPAPQDYAAEPQPEAPAPAPSTAVVRVAPEPRPAPPRPILRPAPAAPLPPSRPAEVALENPPLPIPRPQLQDVSKPFAPRAENHPPSVAYAVPADGAIGPSSRYDRFTAVYDLTAHTVYLPNGTRLEAHSGLGELIDDPRHVNEKDRGATPPHLYELTLRESLFHGVQALRLNPVGDGDVFGRAGMLAHTYMLGPNGDSNGCVSFKNYDAFLQAFQAGQVKRLAVVASLN